MSNFIQTPSLDRRKLLRPTKVLLGEPAMGRHRDERGRAAKIPHGFSLKMIAAAALPELEFNT